MGSRAPRRVVGGLGFMQPTEDSKADLSAGVVPRPRPLAAWRVVAVAPVPEMRLRVTFADGTSGEVWMKSFLESPQISGTIFEPLRNAEKFLEVCVELGAVIWANGADLAPDAMYDAIRSHGRWVLEA
ncbi:MAG: DUF2442 domain-containing protein [Candidatus Binatia bacterium]